MLLDVTLELCQDDASRILLAAALHEETTSADGNCCALEEKERLFGK